MTSPASKPIELADLTSRLAAVHDELEAILTALPTAVPRLNMAPTAAKLNKAAGLVAAEAAAIAEARDIVATDAPLDIWLPDADQTWYPRFVPSPRQLVLLSNTAQRGATITFTEALARNPHLTAPVVTLPPALDRLEPAAEAEDHWYLAESTETEWQAAFDRVRRMDLHGLPVPRREFYDTVYAVTCPKCGATGHQLCRTSGNWPAKAHEPHRDRRTVAATLLMNKLRTEPAIPADG